MARRKPIPGSRPLPKYEADNDNETPAPKLLPPWWLNSTSTGSVSSKEDFEQNLVERQQEQNFTALQQARKRVEDMATAVRNDAFDDWISCCTVLAPMPAEWTAARDLYESYLRHATAYGRNRTQKGLAQQALATETTWGRMMTTLFPLKTRRTNGIYYPLRIKRGG